MCSGQNKFFCSPQQKGTLFACASRQDQRKCRSLQSCSAMDLFRIETDVDLRILRNMSIMITGGAGYIGCHTAKRLSELGREVIVLDNLSTGRRENVRWGDFVKGEISDKLLVCKILRDHRVTAVVHLAASAHVGESIERPDLYFENNTFATKVILDAMREEGVKRFVFASSCSVYGNAVSETVGEEEAVAPVSPYGESKLAVERMLPWYGRAWGLEWIALRYFNVAGAVDDLGEDIALSKRIIPRTLHAVLASTHTLRVYGTAFGTGDGSAVRDYVHVGDIARANTCALRWLEAGNSGATINIGAGKGTSVLEIISAIERETGKKVPCELHPARSGDPGHVIADSNRARRVLGWEPQDSEIQNIIASLARSCELRVASLV